MSEMYEIIPHHSDVVMCKESIWFLQYMTKKPTNTVDLRGWSSALDHSVSSHQQALIYT